MTQHFTPIPTGSGLSEEVAAVLEDVVRHEDAVINPAQLIGTVDTLTGATTFASLGLADIASLEIFIGPAGQAVSIGGFVGPADTLQSFIDLANANAEALTSIVGVATVSLTSGALQVEATGNELNRAVLINIAASDGAFAPVDLAALGFGEDNVQSLLSDWQPEISEVGSTANVSVMDGPDKRSLEAFLPKKILQRLNRRIVEGGNDVVFGQAIGFKLGLDSSTVIASDAGGPGKLDTSGSSGIFNFILTIYDVDGKGKNIDGVEHLHTYEAEDGHTLQDLFDWMIALSGPDFDVYPSVNGGIIAINVYPAAGKAVQFQFYNPNASVDADPGSTFDVLGITDPSSSSVSMPATDYAESTFHEGKLQTSSVGRYIDLLLDIVTKQEARIQALENP